MLYYEKRMIHDINDNTYPIWELYTIKDRQERQVYVFFDKDEIDRYIANNNVTYRKYTSRGFKSDE